MILENNAIIILFVLIIILIIGYLFGLSILNLIDNKLNNIKINFPSNKNIESYKNIIDPEDDIPEKNNKNKKDNKNKNESESEGEIENENLKEIIHYKTYDYKKGTLKHLDKDYYDQMNKDSLVEGFSHNENDTSFKIWNIEKKKTMICIKDHDHIKNGKNTQCTYGVTNHADPKDMSPMDLKIFTLNYPSNMTLQDYINWLYCFKNKEDQLPYNHLRNLEKIKMGKELVEEHGVLPPPGYYYQPMNAEDYFDKMYSGNEFTIASPLNSNTGPMVGFNYGDYSEFSQNTDLYGSTGVLRNNDIGLKLNAKKLHNYIDSRDSNSLNIDLENEKYRIKNVEI